MSIIKNRKTFMIISLAIIVIGLGMFAIKGLNYGIDFTGGTLIEMNVGKFISVDEIREIMNEYDENAGILHAGADKEQVIIKSTLDLSNNDISNIINQFIDKYDMEKQSFQSEKFGALMGKEIRNKAMLSMLIATVAMLLYITWRFEFNFGLSAIIALVHDILIMLAVYSIFRIPVNSSFIAAILTIVGYSINDTIVIFDRIRENLKLNPRESLENTINGSINQSLRRTINTSVTTLLAVVVLYVLGVEDVKVLALPLLIGIVSGTYSSLFIASPILFMLKNRNTIKTAK